MSPMIHVDRDYLANLERELGFLNYLLDAINPGRAEGNDIETERRFDQILAQAGGFREIVKIMSSPMVVEEFIHRLVETVKNVQGNDCFKSP
jgi:hypothetical protein